MLSKCIMCATILLLPASAVAQFQTGAALPSLLIPIEPPSENLPPSGTQGGYLFNLRPLGVDFGKTLADKGIYLDARNLTEGLSNYSGGTKRGISFEAYTAFGIDLDMQRIAGIQGAAIHFLLDDLAGQPFSAWSGSSYLNNRIFAGTGTGIRVNEFSWEQSLFNGRLNLRIGRVPPYTQFNGSELYCTFITSLCRTPAAYTFDRGYPPYLASSWGAIAQVRIAGPFYSNIAVFEDEPLMAFANHGGFPGPDWGFNYSDGATFPVQFGYRTTLQNDAYPRAFAVGGFYNTGRYPDPLLNTEGQNIVLYKGTPKTDIGSSEVYLQAQQMVYRPDSTDRGLTVFAGANFATSGEPVVHRMYFAGAYYKGPFAGRPNDTLGLEASILSVNPRVTERVDTLLALETGGQASQTGISYELNYGLAVAPGMMIKPFLGFISHPDQAAAGKPSGNITHAAFIGCLFEVDLSDLIGLPRMPPR